MTDALLVALAAVALLVVILGVALAVRAEHRAYRREMARIDRIIEQYRPKP